MKKFLCLFLFSILYPLPSTLTPIFASAADVLLWIPSDDSNIEDVIDRISNNPDFKLTIAISKMPKNLAEKLNSLESKGQIELAMRIANDPILPLLYYPQNPQVTWINKISTNILTNNPYFFSLRMADAKEKFQINFKKNPVGFANLSGGVVRDYVTIAKTTGIKWISCGPFVSTTTLITLSTPDVWQVTTTTLTDKSLPAQATTEGDKSTTAISADINTISGNIIAPITNYDMLSSEGVFFIPFSILESTDVISDCSLPLLQTKRVPVLPSTRTLKFWVIDETLNPETQIKSRDILLDIASSSKPNNFLTVSKAIEIAASTEVPKNQIENLFKPWTQDYTLWASSPAQFGAMLALDKTRQEIGVFLNSVQGDMKLVKNLYEDLYLLESSSIFLKLSNPDIEIVRETEVNFLNGLSDIYRQMNHNLPSWFLKPLAEFSSGTWLVEKVEISSGPFFFVFKNTSKKPDLPSKTPSLPKTANPSKIWKLDSFKVKWDDKNIILGFKPLEIDNSEKEPSGFSHIFIDLYIDINQRFMAGSGKLLEGRNARIFPEDAWEYALTLNSKKAEVFKISTAKIVSDFTTKPELDRQSNYIYVTIPRSILRGNPNLWGYSAFMMLETGDNNMHITDILAKEIANGYVYSIRIQK